MEERLGFYFRQMGLGRKLRYMSVLQKEGVVYEVRCQREPSWMRRNSTGEARRLQVCSSSLAGEALVWWATGNEGGEVRPEASIGHIPFFRGLEGRREIGLPLGASRQLTVFIF